MQETIVLARQALQLFIQSLPFGSTFQIISYGTEFEFLFEGKRSVNYDEETNKDAFDQVA